MNEHFPALSLLTLCHAGGGGAFAPPSGFLAATPRVISRGF